jgi:hypothetical protein
LHNFDQSEEKMTEYHKASTYAASTVPLAGQGDAGVVRAAFGIYEISGAMAINSTIDMCHLPKDAIILGGYLTGDDLDTGTEAMELDVGLRTKGTLYGDTSVDADALLNSGVLTGDALNDHSPGAKVLVHFQGDACIVPKKLTVDSTVMITFTAAAAGGGTGTIAVVVYYMMPAAHLPMTPVAQNT